MIRPGRSISHFLRHWESTAALLSESKHVVIFLDFDGTLVRVARRPEQVVLTAASRSVLERLAENSRITLAVISGRRRAELQGQIGIRNIHYLGLYGWETNGIYLPHPSARIALSRAHTALVGELSAFPGVWIENKLSSFSVHLLAAKPDIQRLVRHRIHSLLASYRQRLHFFENLPDVEVVPLSIQDKGAAIRQFLAKSAFRQALPIYFGDDLSEEPAFAAVHRGISILVGKLRPTKARFRLRGPGEVNATLTRLRKAML
jgi:trehalose 6-phosphate phosphatase